MYEHVPLWSLCSLNHDTLREDTSPNVTFEYVDISSVSDGVISDNLETYSFGNAPSRARRLAQVDDIIVSTVRTYLRAIAQVSDSEHFRVYSTGFAILRPLLHVVVPKYLRYVLTSSGVMGEIVASSVGVSYPAIQASKLIRIRVPCPDIVSQQNIVKYLDQESADIDALISYLSSLADKLVSRRQTIILEATGQAGLSIGTASECGVGLKVGWRMIPLKFVLESSQTGVWGDDANGGEDDICCVRVADFDRVRLCVPDAPTFRRVPYADRVKCGIRKGDILVEKSGGTERNPVGTVVAYEGNSAAVCSNFILRLRCREEQDDRFWLYSLHGSYVGGRTWNYVRQTTGIQNLDVNGFMSMSHPAPDFDEQRRIADQLDEVTSGIDAMLEKIDELKSLLVERRAALITDVVTGRKKIPS